MSHVKVSAVKSKYYVKNTAAAVVGTGILRRYVFMVNLLKSAGLIWPTKFSAINTISTSNLEECNSHAVSSACWLSSVGAAH